MNLYRNLLVGVLFATSLVSGFCQVKKIIPGGVVSPGKMYGSTYLVNPAAIVGSFKVENSTLEAGGIKTNGTGGACLVADLNEFGLPRMSNPDRMCSKNSECQSFYPTMAQEGFVGYCDYKGDHKCWVRPGDGPDLCNRSKDYTSPKIWDVNVHYPASQKQFGFTAPRYAFESVPLTSPAGARIVLRSFMDTYYKHDKGIRWRVVACLNGTDPASGEFIAGCGIDLPPDAPAAVRMELFGPPSPELPRDFLPGETPGHGLPFNVPATTKKPRPPVPHEGSETITRP